MILCHLIFSSYQSMQEKLPVAGSLYMQGKVEFGKKILRKNYIKRHKNFSKLTPSFTGTRSFEESINACSRNFPAVCIVSVRESPLASPPVMQEAKRSPVPE